MTRIFQQQLESYLWGMVTLLRTTIDAGDYKQLIFPLLFYKRLSDDFEEKLKRLGWSESELDSQRKSAVGNLALAARLRQETTMPLKWIAARVHLGTSKSTNSNLHCWMKGKKQSSTETVMATKEDRENQL